MATLPESQKIEKLYATRYNASFANKAETLLPVLNMWTVDAPSVVRFDPHPTAFFKVQATRTEGMAELSTRSWAKGDEFTTDFGSHNVGFLKLSLGAEGLNIDAPTRLKITFGEVPYDVTEEIHPCQSWISTSWLPDEVINVDWLPCDLTLPRRYAFRYVRFQIIDTSPKYRVVFKNIEVQAVSSAPDPASTFLEPLPCADTLLQQIDAVSVNTLRSCMQTVFEDGPRRDRRLWMGDLRLQALTNYCTFKNHDLVRRCLYMFAALPREDGSLPACVFEKPKLSPATDYIVDYDILFGCAVHDYCKASGDLETGHELWPTVIGSTQSALAHVDDEFVFSSARSSHWKFIDWSQELDRDAAMQGLIIFALKAVNDLASLLSLPVPFEDKIAGMLDAASTRFYDTDLGLFVSGPQRQISWASQAWMALAGAVNPTRCRNALLKVMADPQAVRPLTPYLFHHVAEALSVVGCEAECVELLKNYWGGMIRAGADTFWECFDPEDSRSSPYGDCHNNSYCHAWSCTPSYLLRTKLRSWLEGITPSRPL
ncbi:bacterial alpha-L-rhamnosidase domain-containing protein [Coniochaeta sp. 2T2.1]|nr:bacterial alpha-L-rhamnosidase domain-containing protein [Coniochaeta sp. 2T2.1]